MSFGNFRVSPFLPVFFVSRSSQNEQISSSTCKNQVLQNLCMKQPTPLLGAHNVDFLLFCAFVVLCALCGCLLALLACFSCFSLPLCLSSSCSGLRKARSITNDKDEPRTASKRTLPKTTHTPETQGRGVQRSIALSNQANSEQLGNVGRNKKTPRLVSRVQNPAPPCCQLSLLLLLLLLLLFLLLPASFV